MRQKNKMDIRGGYSGRAFLIIFVEGYSNLMYLFGIIFTVLLIQLSSLLPKKQVHINPSDF